MLKLDRTIIERKIHQRNSKVDLRLVEHRINKLEERLPDMQSTEYKDRRMTKNEQRFLEKCGTP